MTTEMWVLLGFVVLISMLALILGFHRHGRDATTDMLFRVHITHLRNQHGFCAEFFAMNAICALPKGHTGDHKAYPLEGVREPDESR